MPARAKKVSHRIDYLIFFFFGAVTLFILAVIVIEKCFLPGQFKIIQFILAISLAGLAAGVPGFLEVEYKGWLRAGGGLGVFVLIYLVELPVCGSFVVTARLNSKAGDRSAFDGKKVALKVGPFTGDLKTVVDGEVSFDQIPGEYFGDSIKLIPEDSRLKVEGQSHISASEGKEINFTLTTQIDSTIVRGHVMRDRTSVVPNAQVSFGSYNVVTDSAGYFEKKLPYEVGTSIWVQVIVDGTRIYNYKQVITDAFDFDIYVDMEPQ